MQIELRRDASRITPKIQVLTIAFNGMPIIIQSVQSIIENLRSFQVDECSYCVIDDNSTDGTLRALQDIPYPLSLLSNSENCGYSATLSAFVYDAFQGSSFSEYLFLVNQDAVLQKGCLKTLLQRIQMVDSILAVQPKLLMYEDPQLVNSLGNGLYYLGFGFCYNKYERLIDIRSPHTQNSGWRYCAYCSGAVTLISLRNLKAIWPTSFSFIPYFEDVELGIRGLSVNLSSIVEESATALHAYVFNKKDKLYNLNYGRYVILFSYYPLSVIMALLPALIFFELAIFFIVPSCWNEKLRVYRSLFKPSTWEAVRARRKRYSAKVFRIIAAHFCSVINVIDLKSPLLQKIVDGPLKLYWNLLKTVIAK